MRAFRSIGVPLLVVLAASGCRTPLWELAEDTEWPIADLGRVDFRVVPDLRVVDFSVPPDLRPPPDLTLPFVCRDIWVVDANGTFSGFDTRTRTFSDIGALRCPGTMSSPQTMGVARDGNAWVLYSSGELFRVDVRTASCFATGFDRTQITNEQFVQMGSAFSADQPGGVAETFFVLLVQEGRLSRLDTQTLRLTRGAQLAASGELTGTGDAELWGFFPAMPSFVARIDKQTGAFTQRIEVPRIQPQQAGAFAFAFFGGSFWIFLADAGGDTTVYRVDRQNGQTEIVLQNTGRHILGAGVSSCAPIGLDQ